MITLINPFAPFRRWLAARAEPYQETILYTGGRTAAGVIVRDEVDALSFSGVWACCRCIAETVASLPWHHYRRRPDGGRDRRGATPLEVLLSTRPNPDQIAFNFRASLLLSAQLWGNAYAEIERDLAGRPIALWPLEPHRVDPMRTDAGELAYRVKNGTGQPTYIAAADMFHLAGPGAMGLAGYYVVALFRQAFGLGLASQEAAARFFGNGSMPEGFLKFPGKVSPEKAKELIERFEARHQGPGGRRRLGLLQGGLEYEAVATSNEDAQLDKTRTFQILEACRVFRVPPHKIAELSRATFSNIAEQETAFARDSILPWAIRLEQEADFKLLNRQRTEYTKLNVKALMRGSPADQADYYEKMQRIGALTVNDILELEERNTIGPDGDKRLIPANYTTLAQIGRAPAASSPSSPPSSTDDGPEPPDQDQDDDQPDQPPPPPGGRATVKQLAADLAQWWYARVAGETRRAYRRHLAGPRRNCADFARWAGPYFADAGALLAARLRPLAHAAPELGLARWQQPLGPERLETALAGLAALEAAALREAAETSTNMLAELDRWELPQRAGELAEILAEAIFGPETAQLPERQPQDAA